MFEMGTGGSSSLLSPDLSLVFFMPGFAAIHEKSFAILDVFPFSGGTLKTEQCLLSLLLLETIGQALDLLVSVSSIHYCTSTSDLST